MPAAPKDDGLSRRTGQSVTNDAPTLTATLLPAQNQHWTTDAGPVGYDVIPIDYGASDLARYQAPFLAPNEQSYEIQSGGPLDASVFTNNTIAAGVVAPGQSLGSFPSQPASHPGFYFNVVDPFQQQDESQSQIELANTHQYHREDLTTSSSFSAHSQGTQDKTRPTPTGPQSSLAPSAAGKGSKRPAPASLRPSVKRNSDSLLSSAVRNPAGQSTAWAREIEQTDLHQRMSSPTQLPGTGGQRAVETDSRDQLTTTTSDAIPSDAASPLGDDAEGNGSGGGMVSVAPQRGGSNVGSNQPPGVLQAGRTSQTPHAQPGLPAEKVFPIQIGSELFRLSGASIASDGQ